MFAVLERFSQRTIHPGDRSTTSLGVLAFVALTAAVLAVRFAVGSYPVTLFPDDAMNALAQADYLVQGYRPYVDYFSLHGPFAFQFLAVGIHLRGVSFDAVTIGQMLAAALFGLLMFKTAISRLHPFWAVALAICIELLLVSCTPIGRRSWREFSPAMWYNVVSFTAMSIVFLYTMLPSASASRFSRWLDTVIAAFCLMASFHTKMSFFPSLAIVFFAGTIVWPRNREQRQHGLVAGALAVAMIFGYQWMLGGSVPHYIAFLRSISLKISPLAFALRFLQYTRTLALLAVGLLLVGWAAYEAKLVRLMRREWVLAVLMCGALMAVASTCKQDPESLPLVGVIPLALLVTAATLAKQADQCLDVRLVAPATLIALILIASDAKNGALSLAFSHMSIKTLEPPVERLAEDDAKNSLASNRVDRRLFSLLPRSWAEHAIAGLSLLRQAEAAPGQVLFVATEANGITVLTDLKHARGDSPWSPYSLAENPIDVPPPVDDFLADADWILRDMKAPGYWLNVSHFRGKFLENNFDEVASNDDWTLYRRISTKQSDAGSTP